MAAVALVSLLFLVLSLSGSSPVLVRAREAAAAAAADAADHEYTFVAIASLKPKAACSGHRVSPPGHNGTWLRLSLSHGPCSPSSSSHGLIKSKPSLSTAELLLQDELRVQNIHQMLLLSSSSATAAAADDDDDEKKVKKRAARSTTTAMEHGPVVSVNVGSASSISTSVLDPTATGGGGGGRSRSRRSMPGTVQTMMVDTASDVPWVQCHPPLTGSGTSNFFDPTRSPTYTAFPCGSPACTRLGPAYSNGCVNNQCQYRVTYPDGSSTLGTYSSDVLTITRSTNVPSFQFGCSFAEQGSQLLPTMSLGGGPESLVSQTAATHGNAFSYCVPPTATDAGFFVLGKPSSPSSASAFVRTPMRRFARAPSLYRVNLRGITVAGQPLLGLNATVFAAGAVMDSRAAVTRLPPTAYGALRAAFRRRMGAYRAAPPRGALDTCYDFAGVRGAVRVPRVALVFDGGSRRRTTTVVEMDASGILIDGCLAFAPTGGDDRVPGIIGNVQQQTIEVLYDVGGRSVGFRTGAC